MEAITPKTEVAAVNLILRNAGETPVNSLSGEVPLEASQARETLVEVSEEVQLKGWYFNTEVVFLSPDNNGHIIVPKNTLSVKTWGASRGTPVVARGTKLYNMTPLATGPIFEAGLQLELVLGLPFEELPASARRYVSMKAARVFQVRESGDELNAREDTEDEQRAMADMASEQLTAQPLSLRVSSTVQAITSGLPFNSGF